MFKTLKYLVFSLFITVFWAFILSEVEGFILSEVEGFTLSEVEGFTLSEVEAQEMSSQKYKLQGGNLNTGSANLSSSGFRLSDLLGQTSAQIFTSKGYLIQSGFLNRAATSSLIFTVSPATANFGTLTPNKPATKNLIITIASDDFPGYSVYVGQNRTLSTEAGAEIPDTVCDGSENKICTVNKANRWFLNSAFGFGYSLQGQTVSKDFNQDNYFRPFATLSRKEQPVLIMESVEKKTSHTASMILKVNIPSEQPVGIYQNILTFSALPGI